MQKPLRPAAFPAAARTIHIICRICLYCRVNFYIAYVLPGIPVSISIRFESIVRHPQQGVYLMRENAGATAWRATCQLRLSFFYVSCGAVTKPSLRRHGISPVPKSAPENAFSRMRHTPCCWALGILKLLEKQDISLCQNTGKRM